MRKETISVLAHVGNINACNVYSETIYIYPRRPEIRSVEGISPSCNSGGNGAIRINSIDGALGQGSGEGSVISYKIQLTRVVNNDSLIILPFDESDDSCRYIKNLDKPYVITDSMLFGNNVLTAGTYRIAIENVYRSGTSDSTVFSNGVTYKDVIIPEKMPLTVSISPQNLNCYGDSSGIIGVEASGGNAIIGIKLLNDLGETVDSVSNDTSVFNNLSAASYKVQVIDKNNCHINGIDANIISGIKLTQPDSLVIKKKQQKNVLCFGDSGGSLSFLIEGGTSPYKCILKSNSIKDTQFVNGDSISFSNLKSDVYELKVQDSKNCPVSYPDGKNYKIIQPQRLKIDTAYALNYPGGRQIKCYGDKTGRIIVNASGGTGTYQYLLNDKPVVDVKNDTLIYNLKAGNYRLIVKDKNNCISNYSHYIPLSEPDSLRLSVVEMSNFNSYAVKCFGENSAWVKLRPIGGTPGFKFFYDDSSEHLQRDSVFSKLYAGNYNFFVQDTNGCEAFVKQNLNAPPKPTIDSIIAKDNYNGFDIACFGQKDYFTIFANHNSGVTKDSNFVYSINNGFQYYKDSIFNATAGKYSILIKDNNGCVSDPMIFIFTEPEKLLAFAKAKKYGNDSINIKCNGQSNGAIYLKAKGGTKKYKYFFQKKLSNDTIENLSAGSYFYYVKDANNCISASKSITLHEPRKLSISIDTNKYAGNNAIRCFGTTDTLWVKAFGGFGTSYSNGYYSVKVNNMYKIINKGNISTFDVQAKTPYNIVVSDPNGCSDTIKSVILTQPNKLKFDTVFSLDAKCFNSANGIIKAVCSGGTENKGYTFLLRQNSLIAQLSNVQDTAVFKNYKRGVYKLTAIDANNCKVNTTTYIASPPEIKANSVSVYNPLCNKDSTGSFEIVPTGGVPYFNNTYNYMLINYRNDTTFIKQSKKAFFDNVLVGTNYYFIIDSLNCISTKDSIQLFRPAPVRAEVIKKNVSIAGASDAWAVVLASGGTGTYSYLWKNSNGKIISNSDSVYNLSSGLYTVQVWDKNLCPNENASQGYEIKVEIETQPRVKLFVDSLRNCTYPGRKDGFVSFYSIGGWKPKKYYMKDSAYALTNNFYNLAPGSYNFFVKDSINSIDSLSVTILSPDYLSIDKIITKKTLCVGSSDGQATIIVSGGTQPYLYSLDSLSFSKNKNITGLPAGNYKIFVKDVYGNIISSHFSISQPQPLTVQVTDTVQTQCGLNNGSASVLGIGGTAPYEYSIDSSSFSDNNVFKNLSAGNHKIFVTDVNQCLDSVNVFIDNSDGPKIDSIILTDATCFNTADGSAKITNITGHSPFNIIWSNNLHKNSYTNTDFSRGSHSVKVIDSKSCFTKKSFYISSPPKVDFDFEIKRPTCYGGCDGSVHLSLSNGEKPYNFIWTNLPGHDNNYFIDSLYAGTYNIKCTDALNCVYDSVVTVLNPDKIDILPLDSAYICQGQSYSLDAGHAGSKYKWTSNNGFNSNRRIVNISKAGKYHISLTTPEGCEAKDSFNLYVSEHYLQAEFLMPDSAFVGDTVVIVEISWEAPDYISWKFPKEFLILSNTNENVQIIPTKPGFYSVILNAFLGNCSDITENKIVVSPRPKSVSLNSSNKKKIKFIKSAKIYPNPNNGIFNLDITLYQKNDVSVDVYDFLGIKIQRKQGKNQSNYSFNFNLNNLNQGIYFIKIETNNVTKDIKFIKKN
jgi:hypothetical protein